jgi:hypothetical protein
MTTKSPNIVEKAVKFAEIDRELANSDHYFAWSQTSFF